MWKIFEVLFGESKFSTRSTLLILNQLLHGNHELEPNVSNIMKSINEMKKYLTFNGPTQTKKLRDVQQRAKGNMFLQVTTSFL